MSNEFESLMAPDGFIVTYTEDEFNYHEWAECDNAENAAEVAKRSGEALEESMSRLTEDEDANFTVSVENYVVGKEAHVEFNIDPPRPKGHELMGLMIVGSESLFKISSVEPDMALRVVGMVEELAERANEREGTAADS